MPCSAARVSCGYGLTWTETTNNMVLWVREGANKRIRVGEQVVVTVDRDGIKFGSRGVVDHIKRPAFSLPKGSSLLRVRFGYIRSRRAYYSLGEVELRGAPLDGDHQSGSAIVDHDRNQNSGTKPQDGFGVVLKFDRRQSDLPITHIDRRHWHSN